MFAGAEESCGKGTKMRPEDYNEEDVQEMYNSALSRKNVERENRYTLEMLQRDASRLGYASQV